MTSAVRLKRWVSAYWHAVPEKVQQQIEWHQAPSNTRIGLFHEAEVKITSKFGMKHHLSGWSIFETGCKGMSITSPVAPEMVTDRHTE